ncbi:Zinc finger protein 226 [Eumeta japonica]|uniref:Zinc finger protein 226 n=1 Tax=Eumeta variegata TaxID=151549 RepID=A0A4C1TH80_EUMVA|nr:Zinc finger protein 226 [Eumeta japonica]
MNIGDVKASIERHSVKEELSEAENFENTYESKDFDIANYDSEDDIPLTVIKDSNQEEEIPHKIKVEKKVSRKTLKGNINKCTKKGFQEDYAKEIILSREEQLEELKKRAESLNYIHSPFKCTLCFKGFIDSAAYSNHNLKHDKSSGPHECDVCHCRYSNRRQLTSHIATSHSKCYMCKACGHRSHTANQARDHEKWHRGFVYECKLCGWKFKKPTTHLTHMRKRHPTEWTCSVCGGSFISKHGLLMHQTKMHKTHDFDIKQEPKGAPLNSPERYCEECDVLFVSPEAKQRHMVVSLRHSMHNNNSDTCIACGETFTSKTELARHVRVHTKIRNPNEPGEPAKRQIVKKVNCDTCGAKFETHSKLQVHVKRIHLGLKYNKNVVCEVCGRKCTSNAVLKYHQRTHTGERPYACTSCPKRFSDKNQLRIHARTHTNERPYSCTLCGKTFRQKRLTTDLLRVHTGAKPYECQYCAKTFSQSNSMKLHVKTIHLKMPTKRAKNKPMHDAEEKPDVQNLLTLQ